MRDWNSVPDKREATRRFRDFMEQLANAQIRKHCCDCPKEAKRQFAIIGEFYLEGEQLPNQPANSGGLTPIPKHVEFRMYDTNDTARHDLVVLVLPSSQGGPATDPVDIWIAAWPVWGPTQEMIAYFEAKLAMLRQELAAGER